MKPFTKALVFLLAVIAPLIIVTLALRRPVGDSTRLAELRERYTQAPEPGVDHGKLAILQQDFDNPHQITAACLSCHTERGHELLDSPHFTWERQDFIPGKGVVYIGKKNLINNFCTGVQSNEGSCMKCHAGYGWGDKTFDSANPFNIDCLVCHDNTGTYQKASGMAGYPVTGEKGPDFKAILSSVGQPTSQNCGSCHFYGGGGNNVKHGDLEAALLTAGRQVDVHMGVDGVRMSCVDCHTADNHKMKGHYFGVTATGNNRLSCDECHGSTPHARSILNEHTVKVSCQACHIPVYAKVKATKMEWDWSTATKKLDGKGYEVKDEDGNILYTSAKGDFKWEKNVRPEYVWFNGTADHLLITDKIDTTNKVVKINQLLGDYKDRSSKIVPVKVHRGRQPYDTETLHILQAKLWDRQPGHGALWLDLNWDSAIIKGMEYVGLPYSGKYAFIETEMYLPVNHMVSPSHESVSCKECHTRSKDGRLANLKDFYMPGRDRNHLADMAGRLLLILSFVGVAGHAGMRIFFAKRNNKAQGK